MRLAAPPRYATLMPLKFDLFRNQGWSAPVVIGATGGSGTRLVARLLREMGVILGERINGAEDALAFVELYDRYADPYLAGDVVDLAALEKDLMASIRAHVDPRGHPHWGWKNPRTILLLPLLDRVIPGLRFVHVVRNGLDMAVSKNRNQLLRHGRAALGPSAEVLDPDEAAALLWKQVNEAAADYGRAMAERYFLLRYEDVCANPTRGLSHIAQGLGLTIPAGGWREPVTPARPRWPSLDPMRLERLRAHIGDALQRFGY